MNRIAIPPVKRVKYKEYAGFIIKGTNPVPYPKTDLHMERAAYLATQLESPHMGTVQSYDRCAMSGGPFHFTAIQPKNMVQGSLFKLLQRIYLEGNCESLSILYDAFEERNWYVTRRGDLRDITTNQLVSAREIRNEFTPIDGKVPVSGKHYEQAKAWIILFHRLLADSKTYRAQLEYATDYLINTQKELESTAYSKPIDLVRFQYDISPEEDLALCVYHAHSVNAPGIARKCLVWALNNKESFAKALIWKLGTYKYGRWQDQQGDGHNRYDSTRLKAKASELWPDEFFDGEDAIMPRDLKTKW